MSFTPFNFLPQTDGVQGLLNSCLAALPHIPEPEKGVMISALREFEVFTAPTMWSAQDVDDDFGLTDEEKVQCIAMYSESYKCQQSDWNAIEECARQILRERQGSISAQTRDAAQPSPESITELDSPRPS